MSHLKQFNLFQRIRHIIFLLQPVTVAKQDLDSLIIISLQRSSSNIDDL